MPRARFREGLVRGSVAGAAAAWIRRGPAAGLPLVLLHGAGLDRAGASWHAVLPRLAAAGPLLAPDLPGHGETAPLLSFAGVEDLSRWLLAFLDAAGLDRAILAGVSMGGAVALRLALDGPERVAAVVAVASYGLAARAPFHAVVHAGTRLPLARLTDPLIARSEAAARLALRSIVHDPATITPEMVAEMRVIAADTGADRAFDRFLAAEIGPDRFNTVLAGDLSRLAVPTLFVHGRQDRTIPIAAARAAARLARAPLVELDTGHWPMFEAPDAFLAAVEPFLAGIRA